MMNSANTRLPFEPGNFWIIGPPGIGKRLQVQERIVSAVHGRKPVMVFDYGQNYYKLCQQFGGVYIFQEEGKAAEEICFGHTPLIVYDFERVAHIDEPLKPSRLVPMPDLVDGLVVVDESVKCYEVFPLLPVVVRGYVALGAQFAITGQHPDDVAVYKPMPGAARMLTLGKE